MTIPHLLQSLSLDDAVAAIVEVYDFQYHPYITWMQHECVDRSSFRQTQVPFRFAVEFFPQAIAAVLARVQPLEGRMALVENLAEEHGRGIPTHSHKYTFQEYLQALGASAEDLEAPCPIGVLAFNQFLLGYTLSQPAEVGASLLGIIEYLYIGISAVIAQTLVDRVWVAPNSQSHYRAHEQLDVEHSQSLLKLAQPAWAEPWSRPAVAQGLLLGAHAFWRLYDDLLPII